MSRLHPNEWEQKELVFTCALCDAKPGEWCTTKSGNYVQWLHSSRHYQARDMFVPYPHL